MLLFTADFETIVEDIPEEQKETAVWAWGISRLFDKTENVKIGNCIESIFEFLSKFGDRHIIVWYHNLKFDGSFITSYLISRAGFKTAFNIKDMEFKKEKDLQPGELTYTITDNGIWYSVTVKYKRTLIEFRDSLKLLPFKVSELADAFKTKRKKLEIDYKGHSAPYEEITPEEEEYLKNDVLIVKEALEKFLINMNYEKNPPLTIGQACMREFKKDYNKERWNDYFPNLAEIELDPKIYGYKDADTYIRRSYMGGWCYANYDYTGVKNGRTTIYDVNSLYPSVMHSKSGNAYPIGAPHFFTDKNMLKWVNDHEKYYFIRFRCRFDLREGYLPFMQLKYDMDYRKNENLSHSWQTRYGRDDSKYPELILSKTTFLLFIACYDIKDFDFLSGCWFDQEIGLFDFYINRFAKMKQDADNAKNKVMRTIAKLFMNNLYGKFGTNPENCFYLITESDEDIDYNPTQGNNKKPIAVQIASAVTSYARKFTVTAALQNYDYYRYSDTDSIHLVLPEGVQAKGVQIHDTDLLCWKIEKVSDHSIYLRQKTYIEYGVEIDEEGNSYIDYDIKCCGLPNRGKMLFEANLNKVKPDGNMLTYKGETIKLQPEELEFMKKKRTIDNFCVGLSIPGKLKPKKIIGGVVLVNDVFTIK